MKKQILRIISILMLSVMLFTACSSGSGTQNSPSPSESSTEDNSGTQEENQQAQEDAASTGDDNISTAEDMAAEPRFMKVEYTPHFSVEYLEGGAKLIIDAENQKFLLVPRGDEVPPGYDDATVIGLPVERALFCSTTQVGMIRSFDIWGNIVGISSTTGSFVTMDQDVAESGYEIHYIGGSSAPDYELIQSLSPEIAFVFTGSSGQQVDLIAKLEELGIPYAVDNEYMELKHAGRSEWMKFLAAFFDKDEQAVQYIDDQLKMLEEMQTLIAGQEKPKVAWGLYSNGVMYVPNNGSYVADQLRDAGADYIFDYIDGTSSSQISVEDFYNTLLDADVWIYSSNRRYVGDYDQLIELIPVVADAPVVVNKRVWQFDVDYYYFTDQGAMQVIELAAIFHPELFPGFEHENFNALAE